MNQTIIALCRELAEEAGAICKYTEDIGLVSSENPDAAEVFKDIRFDELEHIQKLALELTRIMSEDEPEAEGGAEE